MQRARAATTAQTVSCDVSVTTAHLVMRSLDDVTVRQAGWDTRATNVR